MPAGARSWPLIFPISQQLRIRPPRPSLKLSNQRHLFRLPVHYPDAAAHFEKAKSAAIQNAIMNDIFGSPGKRNMSSVTPDATAHLGVPTKAPRRFSVR